MAKKPAKKAAPKKKETESKKKPAKKTAAKKTAAKKATAKKTAKKTTTAKSKAAAKPKKTTTSKSKATKSQKAAPVKKKVTLRDLLLRKFDKLETEKPVSYAPPRTTVATAPPIISEEDPQEAKRLRALLLKKFDYAELAAAAEKAAREKAEAEKAAAQKAAKEKAAAQKAAREKAAAQKAAKEKAEAEKAAAQKAAKEKAEAEKAAAQKAAREKAEAEKAAAQKVTVTYAANEEGTDTTMDKTTKILAAAVIGVLLLIVAASMSNMGNYYLKPTEKALEVWRGKFAPKGQQLFMTLPGVKAPANIKAVYSKKDVYPLIFGHYIAQADALLAEKKMPDFAAIRSYLDKAAPFAVTAELKDSIDARLRTLDLMVLLYKAEAAASSRTRAGLDKALDYLASADRMALTEGERALVSEKKKAVDHALAAMRKPKAPKAAPKKVAAPKPETQHKAS